MRHPQKPQPGASDFRAVCSSSHYVDKTLLIQALLDRRPYAAFFTRPHQFGKSLNLDMLRVFFERSAEDTSVYFRDKKIWSCGAAYQKHQGNYSVIFLSFQAIPPAPWAETYPRIRSVLAAEFRRHGALAVSDKLHDFDRQKFSLLATEQADRLSYETSLAFLTRLLHQQYGVPPMLMIDAYDVPLRPSGRLDAAQDRIYFWENLLRSGLKDNAHLFCGLVTGTQDLPLDVNDRVVYSILDEPYSEYFGFTAEEVQALAKRCHAEETYQELCAWYGGYHFGSTTLFRPGSVLAYFANQHRSAIYWDPASQDARLWSALISASPEIQTDLAQLIQGGTIFLSLEANRPPNALYRALLETGYLTVRTCDPLHRFCEAALPNQETASLLRKALTPP